MDKYGDCPGTLEEFLEKWKSFNLIRRYFRIRNSEGLVIYPGITFEPKWLSVIILTKWRMVRIRLNTRRNIPKISFFSEICPTPYGIKDGWND